MTNQEILSDLIPLVKHSGAFILAESQKFNLEKIEFKGRNDLVSYVDKSVEEQLIKGLKELIPNAGFIAEETGESQTDAENLWIIDPLDGTTNFVHGLAAFSISVALIKNGILQLGTVYDVSHDEMYTAILGEGAHCNAEPIQVRKNADLTNALIATGFPYDQDDIDSAYMAVFTELAKSTRGLRRFGSAALDLVWTACGKFDAFYEIGLNSWDVAAGLLIVREAGGVVSDFDGGENYLFGRQIVAGNHKIQSDVLNVLQRHYQLN